MPLEGYNPDLTDEENTRRNQEFLDAHSMPDNRRQVAIMMLEEWGKAESAAVWYEDYASKRPVTGLSKNSFTIHQAASALRNYADALREEILMLMGVDDTPDATLEINNMTELYDFCNSRKEVADDSARDS